ncbi:hypothetical protein EON83_14390 [bacterium]|nr:MAG: hypothetical protein EON83_14390 [bacterium]
MEDIVAIHLEFPYIDGGSVSGLVNVPLGRDALSALSVIALELLDECGFALNLHRLYGCA